MKIFIISVILFFILVFNSNAQSIYIDSLYFVNNDTIMFNTTNRFYVSNLWVSYNMGKKKKIYKIIVDKTYKYNNRTFSLEIIKCAFNEKDSLVYHLKYHQAQLSIRKVKLSGATLFELKNPYDYMTPQAMSWIEENYIQISEEIADYTYYENLKLKDIDIHIDNNIMTLQCYKYSPKIVVFMYDFNTKEWTISEERELTEEEIADCGLYNLN